MAHRRSKRSNRLSRLFAWAVAVGSATAVAASLAWAVTVEHGVATGLALAVGVIGASLLAATLPDDISPTWRRRRTAVVGFAALLAAGALPIEIDRSASIAFAVAIAAWFLAVWLLVRTTKRMVSDLLAQGFVWSAYAKWIATRGAANGPSGGESTEEAFQRYLEWVDALPPGILEPAVTRIVLEEGLLGNTDEIDAVYRSNERRGRGWEQRSNSPEVLHAAQELREVWAPVLQRERRHVEHFDERVRLVLSLPRSLRASGPAIVAFCFVVGWTAVIAVAWAIAPGSWNGINATAPRFGDFVYLAVGSAFGDAPSGVTPVRLGARMLQAAESLSAATVLAAYLLAAWGTVKDG